MLKIIFIIFYFSPSLALTCSQGTVGKADPPKEATDCAGDFAESKCCSYKKTTEGAILACAPKDQEECSGDKCEESVCLCNAPNCNKNEKTSQCAKACNKEGEKPEANTGDTEANKTSPSNLNSDHTPTATTSKISTTSSTTNVTAVDPDPKAPNSTDKTGTTKGKKTDGGGGGGSAGSIMQAHIHILAVALSYAFGEITSN